MTKRLEKIETHAHYIPAAVYGAAGEYGPEKIIDDELGLRMWRAGKWQSEKSIFRRGSFSNKISNTKSDEMEVPIFENPDASARLQMMDDLDIDVMAISASPMIYCYGAPKGDGIRYAQTYNDEMAKYCSADPNRLFFIPTLPMQDIPAAIAEARRAHSLGGRGVNIGTDMIAGMDLDDERLHPFYEYCAAENVTIWLHPAPIGTDDPGHDPDKNAEDKYSFGWLLGYTARETVAFGALVYSGILDRFPSLKICLPHGGGFVPYQIGRLEYAAQKKLSSNMVNEKPVRDYLKNFYFDNVVHDVQARRFLIEIMGSDNVFVGSNFGGWDYVNGFQFAADMVDDPLDLRKLCATNAIKLFDLAGMGREIA